MSLELSIATLNSGGVVEAIDEALQLVANNIADVNTPPDKMREVMVKIQIKPDVNRALGTAKVIVTPKLQPQEAQVVSVLFDRTGDRPTIYKSFADHLPDQNRLLGTSKAELRASQSPNVTQFKAAK